MKPAVNNYHTNISDIGGFERLARILETLTGIHLQSNRKNQILLSSRLSGVMTEHGCRTYDDYVNLLSGHRPEHIRQFVSAMCTKTTHFFREVEHFQILTELIKTKVTPGARALSGDLRVWCAASSTGQEPYSILMTILSNAHLIGSGRLRFLATDLDEQALTRAEAGIYDETHVGGVTKDYLEKYFDHLSNGIYQVKGPLRKRIRFAGFNLKDMPYTFNHGFDIIFCRNVLIYFRKELSLKILAEMCNQLRPGGHLFLSHVEGSMSMPLGMKRIAQAVYRKA